MKQNGAHSAFHQQIQNNRNRQIDKQSMTKVYSMLTRQQQAIQNLINKYSENTVVSDKNVKDKYKLPYNDDGLHDLYIKPRSQTIDSTNYYSPIRLKIMMDKNIKKMSHHNYTGLNKSRDFSTLKSQRKYQKGHTRNQSVSLPTINQKQKFSKQKNKQENQFASNYGKKKKMIQNQLYRIYGQKNPQPSLIKYKQNSSDTKQNQQKNKQKRKKKNLRKNIKIDKVLFQNPAQSSVLQQQNQPEDKNTIDDNQIIDSDDSSQQEQISTMVYEKQFRQSMKSQCLQELNFLYFSKNSQLKDWTDSLLSMIQKHDKQITAIRIKSKYLHTFDDKFFSIGIYNSDDI